MDWKRFWVRKVLGKVYDEEEVLDGDISFGDMNNAERDLFLTHLVQALLETQEEIRSITSYLGNVGAPCDKCDFETDAFCFKCEGTKVIQHKTLCDWPW